MSPGEAVGVLTEQALGLDTVGVFPEHALWKGVLAERSSKTFLHEAFLVFVQSKLYGLGEMLAEQALGLFTEQALGVVYTV